MRFPKKTNYLLILFLVVLSFALRFPSTPHNVGVDAFVMQGLANRIVEDSYAAWIIHPLSYFGLFPLSYPSAGIFLPAGLTVVSGLSLEVSILILSFLMGIIGVLGAYLLAREVKDDDVFAFIVAFAFCLAPKFILNTAWETPTRGGFMAFTPIFLWTLLRAHRNPSKRNITIAVLMLVILATFHRLAILMLIVILSYIFTSIFLILAKIMKLKMPTLFLKPRARSRVRFLGVLGLFGLATALLFGSGVLDEYYWGQTVTARTLPTIPAELINLGVSVTRSSGVLTPLLFVGALALAYQRNKTLKEYLILFVVLAIIPTLYLRRYTGFYLPVFIALLAGLGVVSLALIARRRKKVIVAVILSILVGTLALTGVLLDIESEKTDCMTMEEYSTALYVRREFTGTLLSNNGLSGSRIAAVAGHAYLPIGGATVPQSGPEQLAFGFVTSDSVRVVQVPLDKLTINSDSPFYAEGVASAQADYGEMHKGILGSSLFEYARANELYDEYNVKYALEDKIFYGRYTAYATTYYSRLLTNIHDQRYKSYETERNLVWSF